MYRNFILHVGNYNQAFFYLLIALFCLWFLRTLKATFFHVYLWQLKEYRLDRFWDHFTLKKNRQEAFPLLFWIRILAAIVIPFIITSTEWADALFFIPVIFILEIIAGIVLLFQHKLKRPVFTKKTISILGLTLILQILPLFILGWIYYTAKIAAPNNLNPNLKPIDELLDVFIIPLSFGLTLALTFILPITVFLIVLIFKPITYLFKKYYFKKAKEKMSKFPNLKVIGITGSYGKTSTKEFLFTILSAKFKVVKTEKHNNTEIGVAQTILTKLKKEHEIFIVEMGAYQRGEIKLMCDIVQPKIGILTGINQQHLSLFGSQENINRGKYELIESLPKDGLAIFNGDNKTCVELYNQTDKPKKIYSRKIKADIYADQIEIKENGLEFLLFIDQECKKVQSKLLGRHNISNLLAAVSAASSLGMSITEIATPLSKIEPIDQTMKIIIGQNGIKLIDDSYNANPDGVLEALEFLKVVKSSQPDFKTIIIMPSMLELGESAKEAHLKVGQKIGEVCDFAIFLDDNFLLELKSGISEKVKIMVENNSTKILNFITKEIGYNSVVLFESRGANKVLEKLK